MSDEKGINQGSDFKSSIFPPELNYTNQEQMHTHTEKKKEKSLNPYSPNSRLFENTNHITKPHYTPGKLPPAKTLLPKNTTSINKITRVNSSNTTENILLQTSPERLKHNKTANLKSEGGSGGAGSITGTQSKSSSNGLVKKELKKTGNAQTNEERQIGEDFNHNKQNSKDEIDEEKLKEQANNVCVKVFMQMSKYNKEDNTFYLYQQNLVKIIKDIGILGRLVSFSELDVIIKRVNPNSIKYDLKLFKIFIANLACKIDPAGFKRNSKQMIREFIFKYFTSFMDKHLENIEKHRLSYSENNLMNVNLSTVSLHGISNFKAYEDFISSYRISADLANFINYIYPALKVIYQAYFFFEIGDYEDYDKIRENSLKDLLKWASDFEVMPYLIKRDQIVLYWNLLITIDFPNLTNNPRVTIIDEKRDLGTIFKLSKFLTMIVHTSMFTYNKNVYYSDTENLECEKLMIFLDKLNNSKGFENLNKKTNRPYTSKLNLIPSDEALKTIAPGLLKSQDEFEKKDTTYGLSPTVQKKRGEHSKTKLVFQTKNKDETVLEKILNLNSENLYRIHENMETVKAIFDYYSKKGEKTSNFRINLSGYKSFVKDLKVLELPESSKFLTKNYSLQKTLDERAKSLSPQKNLVASSSEIFKMKTKKGFINETELYLLFTSVAGVHNYDNSSKIRTHFNKNKGIIPNLDDYQNVYKYDRERRTSEQKENVIMKLDMNLFLKSFELLSVKLYPDLGLDAAFEEFFENNLTRLILNHTEKIIEDKQKYNEAIYSLMNEEIDEILRDISGIVYPHFQFYSNRWELLSYDQFFNFCKDFEIFPGLCTLITIKKIFFELSNSLAKVLKEANNNSDIYDHQRERRSSSMSKKVERDFINFEFFIKSLALIAFSIKYSEEYEDIYKILYLVERMSKSKGIQVRQEKTGQTYSSLVDFSNNLSYLRQKYPNYYDSQKQSKFPKIEYEEIYD